jgi:ABC-type transporter Mla subunit MlaD
VEVTAMKARRRWAGVWILVLGLVLVGSVSSGQLTFPWSPEGTSSGNNLNFGNVQVGTTATGSYTFKVREDSTGSVTVTQIAFSGGQSASGPFRLTNLPPLPATLSPGQSITFQVTFSPTAAQPYSGSFALTTRAQVGFALQTQKHTVTLTGTGVAGGEVVIPGTIIQPGGDGQTTLPISTYPSTTDLTGLTAKVEDTAREVDYIEEKLCQFIVEFAKELGQALYGNEDVFLGIVPVRCGIFTRPYWPEPEPILPTVTNALASLEAKLDQLLYEPTPGTTAQPGIEDLLGRLEAKLDALAEQPSDATVRDIHLLVVEIHAIIVQINQLVINIGGNLAGIEAKLDQLSTDLNDMWADLVDLWTDLTDMWDDMHDRFDDVEDAIAANAAAIRALQASNARIEDKLNQLLGLPAAPPSASITLTVTPATVSAADHTAVLEGLPSAVEGSATVNVYWVSRDAYVPGVTDSFWFDSFTAASDGSFSFSKSGWGNSWPNWCEITQTNAEGESAPARVYNTTVMIGM